MESNRSGGPADANAENKAAAIRNRNEKLIRLITVIAYFCSVSGAAVMLSLYYIFLWDPDPRSNHAAFQEPNSLYTPHSQLPNSLSSTFASPLLRHLIGNHTTVTVPKSAYSTVIMPGENNKVKKGQGNERNTKLIRIFTVVIYICSVSIAAAVLSLYYFFIWDPAINNQNNTFVTFTTNNNNTSHLLRVPYSKSSSINATSPLLQPILGNCSLGTNTDVAHDNLTALMEGKPTDAF